MVMQKTSSYDGHIFSTSIVTYVVAYYNMEIPYPSGNFCEIIKNGAGEEWLDLDVARDSALKILNKQIEDPTYIDRLISIFNKKRDVFLRFFGEFQNMNLKEMTNQSDRRIPTASRWGMLSFGHIFQKLVAASSGVSNPVFEMKNFWECFIPLLTIM